jgi:FolB domain-containing protein
MTNKSSTETSYIHVKNFHDLFRVGIYDAEKLTPQPLKIDVDIAVSGFLDYAMIADYIASLKNSHIELLEEMANMIADYALSHATAEHVKVTIKKTDIIKSVDWVGVSMERSKIASKA